MTKINIDKMQENRNDNDQQLIIFQKFNRETNLPNGTVKKQISSIISYKLAFVLNYLLKFNFEFYDIA